MNIKVTNVRVMQTSTAFECKLWLDGKPVGLVSNDGRGGCHDWRPIRAEADWRTPEGKAQTTAAFTLMNDAQRRIEAAAKTAEVSDFEAADFIVSALVDGVKGWNAAVDYCRSTQVEYEAQYASEEV